MCAWPWCWVVEGLLLVHHTFFPCLNLYNMHTSSKNVSLTHPHTKLRCQNTYSDLV